MIWTDVSRLTFLSNNRALRTLYLLGNIETGKSKKEFKRPSSDGEREQEIALHISREAPERKKGEKILVLVHFFEAVLTLRFSLATKFEYRLVGCLT